MRLELGGLGPLAGVEQAGEDECRMLGEPGMHLLNQLQVRRLNCKCGGSSDELQCWPLLS